VDLEPLQPEQRKGFRMLMDFQPAGGTFVPHEIQTR